MYILSAYQMHMIFICIFGTGASLANHSLCRQNFQGLQTFHVLCQELEEAKMQNRYAIREKLNAMTKAKETADQDRSRHLDRFREKLEEVSIVAVKNNTIKPALKTTCIYKGHLLIRPHVTGPQWYFPYY